MRQFLIFIAGLVAALLFAGASMATLGLTFILARDLVESRGDSVQFEARLGHSTDSPAEDGGLMLRRNPHPIVTMFGTLAAL